MLNLDKNKNYLLACSFGPDSMALFSMLLEEGFSFSVALVNYHLRKESNDEMNDLIEYAKSKNITYHIKDVNYKIGASNIEAECRKIRYEFFAQLVGEYHYDAVLVAHHQDDLIETYLMQKSRKNLVNFYGIKEKIDINGVTVIRPLLNVTKEYLLDYCHQNNIPYAIDSSNLEDRFLRNKIRHKIVSKMSEKERMRTIKNIASDNKTLSALFKKLEDLDIADVGVLKKLSDVELTYALNMLAKMKDETLTISFKQCKNIKPILFESSGNVDIPIKKGFYLRKSYDRVEIITKEKLDYSIVIEKPCIFECDYFYLNFLGNTTNRNVTRSDYPLTIRNYHSGDKYMIKNYVVSVRRLFIDWKVPLSLRERWPIILNKDNKIIYIPHYQKGYKPSDKDNFYVK